jgi:formylglycine-generating enzyme required for sulfatase activity
MDLEKSAHQVTLAGFCIDVTEIPIDAYEVASDRGETMPVPTDVAWPTITPRGEEERGRGLHRERRRGTRTWRRPHGVSPARRRLRHDGARRLVPEGAIALRPRRRHRQRHGVGARLGRPVHHRRGDRSPQARHRQRRVIRGGAWTAESDVWVRPSFRYSFPPETRSHGVGFRCAPTLSPTAPAHGCPQRKQLSRARRVRLSWRRTTRSAIGAAVEPSVLSVPSIRVELPPSLFEG